MGEVQSVFIKFLIILFEETHFLSFYFVYLLVHKLSNIQLLQVYFIQGNNYILIYLLRFSF